MNKIQKFLGSIITALVFIASPFVVSAQVNVNQGGTGQLSFPQNSLIYSDSGGLQRLRATSSPTVGYINATSTATSTYAGGVDASRFCLTGTTTCLGASTPSGLTFGQGWELNGSGDLAPTTSVKVAVQNLNNVRYIPTDFATNGCAASTTSYAKTFQGCVRAFYDQANAQGQLGVAIIVPFSISETQWTDTIYADINGVAMSISCLPGVQLKFGGSKGLTGVAVKVNYGNPTAHWPTTWSGCQYLGQTSLIAAGQTNTSLNYGIDLGGNQGAVGFTFEGNTVNGFGTDLRIGANAYMPNINFNNFSGGNGTTTARGSLIHINAASNSGERNNFLGNSFTDPGNSQASNAIYITNSGTASNFFSYNSFDDVQLFCGASNGMCSVDHSHIENSDYTHYGAYIPILGVSSDRSTMISFTNNSIANDTSGANSFATIIKHGGQLYAAANIINNYAGGTVAAFVDHSLDNGVATDYICQTQVQSGALTNIVAGSGGVAYSLAMGNTCVYNVGNSYTIGLRANSSNTNNFFSGSVDTGSYDHSGNWGLGAGSGSTVTINNTLAVTSAATVGTTITVSGTATSSIGNLEGSLDVNRFSGSDIGAKANAAFAQAARGQILVLPCGNFTYSTPINFVSNSKTVLLQGCPAEGTTLIYTGTGAAITMDTGTQATNVNHTSGNGISGVFLLGNNMATSSPQIGVVIGGTYGCDGCVLNATNVFGFGYGIETKSHVYHFLLENSTIRNNGQNIHIDSHGAPDNATDAGESMDFLNDFIVDGNATFGLNAVECFYLGDYSTASVNITGGSIDDCQLHIGIQNLSVTLTGVHMENPGQATWGKYTYVDIADSSYTNFNMFGGTLMNDATTNSPSQFILYNGAQVNLVGVSLFNNSGSTVTNLGNGGGRITWSGLNNTNTAVTNISSGFASAFTQSGNGNLIKTNFVGGLGIASSSPALALGVNGGIFFTSTSTGMNGINLTAGCFSIMGTCIGGSGGGSSASSTLLADNNTWTGKNNFLTNLEVGTSSNPVFGLTIGTGTAGSGTIFIPELVLATSTSMSIGMASSTQQKIGVGTAGMTITISPYQMFAGLKTTITTCSPGSTAGAITFANLHYSGGTQPGNTTTANQCDMWYISVINGTSTPIAVLTGMTAGVQ